MYFLWIICAILMLIVLIRIYIVVTMGKFHTDLCLVDKTAIVTGGNSGMGYETSLFLASRGCKVIIADVVNAEKTVEKIKTLTNNPKVSYQHLDLASFKSVRNVAETWLANETRLDILINNAGCGGLQSKTEDNIYTVLQVNYFGHFLLTHLLAPLLKTTKNSRVVFISSFFSFYNNLSSKNEINYLVNWPLIPISAHNVFSYGNSKACIIAAVNIFAEKFQKYGVKVISCNPGAVRTPIFNKYFENSTTYPNLLLGIERICLFTFLPIFCKTPIQGIQSCLYSAFSEEVKSGEYISDCKSHRKPKCTQNPVLCQRIWDQSIKLCGLQNNEITI